MPSFDNTDWSRWLLKTCDCLSHIKTLTHSITNYLGLVRGVKPLPLKIRKSYSSIRFWTEDDKVKQEKKLTWKAGF